MLALQLSVGFAALDAILGGFSYVSNHKISLTPFCFAQLSL